MGLAEALLVLLGSSFGAALVNALSQAWQAKADRKAKKDDTDLATLAATAEGVKYLLYVEILRLGTQYIADGEVDFEDRRILNLMHHTYHDGLNGNGDLDGVMDLVNKLPLKL